MSRLIVTAIAPLVDVLAFDALIAAGSVLPAAHVLSFALAIALNYLLKVRHTASFQRAAPALRIHGHLLVVAFLALFLRAGILGWLTGAHGWPAQLAIVFAVVAGMAVTHVGYARVLEWPDRSLGVRRIALPLIGYAIALRLVFAAAVELLPEETYYWDYSRHLDIGYLDHPPMVAWLIWIGTHLFGQSEFGVRFGALCCGAVTSFFSYRLTRNLFGESSALAALLLAQTLPFFFLSGLLMTPDAPLTAAWAASLYFLERALIGNRSRPWLCAGLSLGIGVVSKYSIGLLGPVVLVFMLWDAKSRRWWTRWEPYAAVLIALAVFSPVIIWNAQHEWASFVFQTSRRLAEAPRFSLHKLFASTLILITPTGVLAVAVGLLQAQGVDASRRWRFISTAVLVPLAAFALFSLRHEVKLDWTGAPWTAALPVMAYGLVQAGQTLSGARAWVQRAWMPTLLSVLLLLGFGLHYLVLGAPGLGYNKQIELLPVGWRDAARQVVDAASEIRRQTGVAPLIVGMDRYAIASELSFYGSKQTGAAVDVSSTHLFEGVGLMYERWAPAAAQAHRTVLLVSLDPRDLDGKLIESHLDRLGPITDAVLTKDGEIIRPYYYRTGFGYSPSAH